MLGEKLTDLLDLHVLLHVLVLLKGLTVALHACINAELHSTAGGWSFGKLFLGGVALVADLTALDLFSSVAVLDYNARTLL